MRRKICLDDMRDDIGDSLANSLLFFLSLSLTRRVNRTSVHERITTCLSNLRHSRIIITICQQVIKFSEILLQQRMPTKCICIQGVHDDK